MLFFCKKDDVNVKKMMDDYNELRNTIELYKNKIEEFENNTFNRITLLEESINNIISQNSKEAEENKKLLENIIFEHKEYVNFFSNKEEIINNKFDNNEIMMNNLNERILHNNILLENIQSQLHISKENDETNIKKYKRRNKKNKL